MKVQDLTNAELALLLANLEQLRDYAEEIGADEDIGDPDCFIEAAAAEELRRRTRWEDLRKHYYPERPKKTPRTASRRTRRRTQDSVGTVSARSEDCLIV